MIILTDLKDHLNVLFYLPLQPFNPIQSSTLFIDKPVPEFHESLRLHDIVLLEFQNNTQVQVHMKMKEVKAHGKVFTIGKNNQHIADWKFQNYIFHPSKLHKVK